MKKFTTTFFLLMAMVLLLPTEVKAWDNLYLSSTIDDKWDSQATTLITRTDGNNFSYEIPTNKLGTDIFFRLWEKENDNDNRTHKIVPADGDKTPLVKGSESKGLQDPDETSGINQTCWKIEGNKYSSCKIVVTYKQISNEWGWWVSIEATEKPDAYVPTLDNKDEISCFVEVPSTINEVKIWAWNDSYNYSMNVESSEDWGNRPSMTYMGETISGNKVYKWTYTGTQTGTPSSVIFTKGDAVTDKFANDIAFTNHGYYVYDGTNNISSSSKIITDVSGGETTTTATLAYGSKSVEGTEADGVYTFANIPYTAFNGTSVSFQLKTVTNGVTTYYNMPNGTTSINAGQGYTATASTSGSDWTYTKDTAPNKGSFSVTLDKGLVTLIDKTSTSTTPTPVTGKNLYLVGNFFDNETAINYNCRYFKLTDNGDNSYSIDIPATLSVNAQLLHVDGENETVYGPNSNGYGISKTWPSGNNGSVPDQPLAEGTKNLTKYWTFADRGLNSDGMYTLTVKLNDEGVPATWSITHDLLNRVAYFIANTEGATVHPAYSKRNNENASGDNKYFGSIYLPANTGCYVISNITKQSDSGNHDLRKTTTKFYLQGNETGGNPITGNSKDTKVFPVQYNGSATIYQPFVFNPTEGMQYLLEYNPTQGEDEIAKNYGYVGGEVQVRKGGTLGDLVVKSMKIVGPAIKGDGWDLTANALDMTYNLSENCWEVTFDTTNPAGEYFRFVANDDWKSHWIENGTTDEDKAKIPYDGAGVGQPATVAVPNEVSYTTTERAQSNKEYDIIFNRNAGRWTVKFYIETESAEGGNYFKYKFRYTINGYKSILRTYCMPENRKPTDDNIKIYGAYAFDDASGKVKLYEMNYIPANEGVILIGTGVDYVEAAEYTPVEGETKYKKIADGNYNNYLVGVLEDTEVNASVFEGNTRVGRNFFFNYLSDTGYYKDGDTDYLGFFRIKSGSTCKANHAYLHLPTTVLTWNGQTLDDVLENETSTLSKGLKLTFGIADEDFGFVTGINDVQKEVKTDNSYYTLQGIRVNTPSKGIYIHNGKKIVIK